MITWYWNWLYRRRLRPFQAWQRAVVNTLLSHVMPAGEPWQFDVAPSFLQAGGLDARDPVRLTLLFPELPLAIDVQTPETGLQYSGAAPYVDRARWALLTERQANKEQRLTRYGCPYLLITPDEPTTPTALKNRLRQLTGR